jgi:hypothetical protein
VGVPQGILIAAPMPTRVLRSHKPKAFVPKPPHQPVFKAPPVYVPKVPPAGDIPRPRRLRLLRDEAGVLVDLFEFFPDLPRPRWFTAIRVGGTRFWRRFRTRHTVQ